MATRRTLRRGFRGLGPWWGGGATPLAFILLAALATPSSSKTTPPPPACSLDGGEDRTVTRVIDGETLQLDGGGELKLIGALAPRAFDTAGGATDWPLADVARTGLDRLVAGRNIRIAFAGRRTDRYGRLLAHVFTTAEGGQTWVQGELLKRGLARAYALEGSTHCLAELIAHEAVAREAAVGLWADTTYAVRSADDISALLRLAGTFQIVEGTVVGVSDIRGTTYINFGEDWRQDFTILLRQPVHRGSSQSRVQLDELKGRLVRVRGWIERRGGPLIEVPHVTALEVLAEPAATSESQAERPAPRRRARRPQ